MANAESLALAICPIEKGSREQYWTNSAASLLTAVLLYLTDREGLPGPEGETKTLASRPRYRYEKPRRTLQEQLPMQRWPPVPRSTGLSRENAASFIDLADVTYSGVLSNLVTATKFLSDPQTKKNTASSFVFDGGTGLDGDHVVHHRSAQEGEDAEDLAAPLLISAGMQTFKNNTGPVTRNDACS